MAEKKGRHRRAAPADRVARAAMELCCGAYQVSIYEMMQAARSRADAAYARQVAMYLAHVVGRLTFSEVSTAFERDRSTVGHACHMVEDRRDEPTFDQEIERLEDRYRDEIRRLRRRRRSARARCA